jgi:GxxExxY protein
MYDPNELARIIVDSAYRIHVRLGPGLLESVYETVMAKDLEARGLKVQRQKSVSFEFEGIEFSDGYRPDLIVNETVIVEIKSVSQLLPVHYMQLLTYLRLLDYRLGLLLNFNTPLMKYGVKRVVNRL